MYYAVLLVAILLVSLAILFLQIFSHPSTSDLAAEYLPGFQGPLPFQLETGYVGVGESGKDAQLFYYFIKSEDNPKEHPLILWISGGPAGCSSFSSLFYEVGPLAFKVEEYNGSLPNLVLRPQPWTKACSMIFVDLPAGTGFSYATTKANQRSDWKTVHHAHQFLRKWLVDHPEFLSNEVYIGAESYSGIIVPPIVQEISNGNENGVQPLINLQGYLLGNPLTTRTEENYAVPFFHGKGIIPDELYTSLQRNCKGDYINSSRVSCSRDVDILHQLTSKLNGFHVLEPQCETDSPEPHEDLFRRTLTGKSQKFLRSHLTLPPSSCRSYAYLLSSYWANDDKVRNALHVRKGTIKKWERCNFGDLKYEIPSSFEYHLNVSKKGYRSLIYSGDHDPGVPFMATQAWIRALNYSIVDDWRPWIVRGQVAGYTRTYSNKMTFATVKGAGHLAPEYKPEESFAMFTRWISNTPL